MLEGSHSKSLSFNYAVGWEGTGINRGLFIPLSPDMLGSAATSPRNIRDNALELGQVRNSFDYSQAKFSCSSLKVLSGRSNLTGKGFQSSIRKESTPSSTNLML